MKIRLALFLLAILSVLVPTTLAYLPPSAPNTQPPAQRTDCGIDLVMVLDSSGSIVYSDYELMKTFVVDLVESFKLGPTDANISIIQFSETTRLEIGLSGDSSAIVGAVRAMPKLDMGTNITSGLELAHEQLIGGREDVPKVIIVLTDGMHNTGPSPILAAADLRGEGSDITGDVTILGVAVGDFQLGELVMIAGGDFNVIQVPNFDGLQLIKSILYDYSCAVVTGERTSSLPTSAAPSSQSTPQGTPLSPPTLQAQAAIPTTVAAGPTPTLFAPNVLGDSTQLAFASDRDGDGEIFVMDANGANLRQLTDNQSDDNKPAWSPDGSQLAFESNLDGDYDIYVMNADGSNIVNLTNNELDDWGADWSPDGTKFAYHSAADGDIEIWVMNVDGTNPKQLTFNLPATDRSPAWSADGTQVIYFSDVSGGRELYTVDVASGDFSRLTNDEYYDGHPDWSPLGTQIAFSSTRVNANAEIFTMNVDGTNLKRLTNYEGIDEDPSWSPDGTQLAFESTQSGNYDIWVMNADGTGLVQLTNDPAQDWSVDWAWKP